MPYTPLGEFGPDIGGVDRSDTIPATNSPLAPTDGLKYNPSGEYVAYDSSLFETLTLPYRAAGDESASDPVGNGGNPAYGYCAPGPPPVPSPPAALAGRCPNHQLEYLDYYEETMEEILGPFGVVIKRYPFESPGSTNTEAGQSYNVAAVVPGADHPDETVLVSGHYDQTADGPASAWDSAEGHAQVIRMAKIMADYWEATGTRPSATIKFVPWDQEESGLLGSADYVANNIPPGEEDKVRGYFNVDPCGGAYPAFYRGNPADRVPLTLQLVNPEDHADDEQFVAEVEQFNSRAETIVDDVFNNLDDNLETAPGSPPIYVSDEEAAGGGAGSQRDEVQTALGGLLLFSSDYANFEAIGVPFFNLGPAFFGPSANGDPNREDGLAILHTPNDNTRTINALTNADQTGSTASEGWAKGMELCAQLESWYMLQPEMAGGQIANTDTVAYYEALPNEAVQQQAVSFDASGSHELDAGGAMVDGSQLSYAWDFGDGQVGTGKTVQHAYEEIGTYTSTLTVTNSSTGGSDVMSLPITVIGSNFRAPELGPLPATDEDGSFPLVWDFDADRDGFESFSVQQASDYTTLFADDAEAGPEPNWTVSEPEDAALAPWQPSDSGTPKFRGNQARSGERSFWTGVPPPDFPGPQNQTSVLTMKSPLAVPVEGDPRLSYASIFQSEGDDQGRVEVATTDGTIPPEQLSWEPVDIVAATQTALGQTDEAICNPSEPGTFTSDFQARTADLGRYSGETILVRFVYVLGPADRALSQPCGWYVDDVAVGSGTFSEIATTQAQNYEVTDRAAGEYAYRIIGRYTDGVETSASNIESIEVTRGAGPGPDSDPSCPKASNVIRRGAGDDDVRGTPRGDSIRTGAGDDRIKALDGSDCARGGKGKDVIRGGGKADLLKAGAGADKVSGGGGDDRLNAGTGRDKLGGGTADDVIRATDGERDIVKCGAGKDVAIVDRRDRVAPNCERLRGSGALRPPSLRLPF